MESTEVLYSRNRQAQRHRWCVEKQRIFASFINVFFLFYYKAVFARFLKTFFYQSYQQYVHYGSVALCAFGTSVRLSAFTSVFSPSLCDFYMQQAYFITPYFGRTTKITSPPTLFIRKEGRCLRYIPSPYTLLYVKKNLKLKNERAQITFKLTPNWLAKDALLRSY